MEDKIKKTAEEYSKIKHKHNNDEFYNEVEENSINDFVEGVKSKVAKEYWFEQFKELFRSAHVCGYFYFDDNHVWMYEEINPETQYDFEDWFNKQKEQL